MTVEEFIHLYRTAELPAGLRRGQHAFNSLEKHKPELARAIYGTEVNPLEDDSRLDGFDATLRAWWSVEVWDGAVDGVRNKIRVREWVRRGLYAVPGESSPAATICGQRILTEEERRRVRTAAIAGSNEVENLIRIIEHLSGERFLS